MQALTKDLSMQSMQQVEANIDCYGNKRYMTHGGYGGDDPRRFVGAVLICTHTQHGYQECRNESAHPSQCFEYCANAYSQGYHTMKAAEAKPDSEARALHKAFSESGFASAAFITHLARAYQTLSAAALYCANAYSKPYRTMKAAFE